MSSAYRGAFLIGLLLCVGLGWSASPQAAPRARRLLHLRTVGSFDPLGTAPTLAPDLTHQDASRARDRHAGRGAGLGHWIVQFDGPVEAGWRLPIAVLGGRLFDYLPDDAYVVRIANQQVDALAALPHVRSVTPYHPAYALSPTLPSQRRAPVLVSITTFIAADLEGVKNEVQALGGQVEAVDHSGRGRLDAELPSTALRQVARVFGVSWIQPRSQAVYFNDRATGVTHVDAVRANVGLYGANQVVAVYDTGLDTGDASTVHPDFTNRILAAHVYNDRGTWSDPHSHGTHTMGTVLGSGAASGADPSLHYYPTSGSPPAYTGMAPEAQLVVQSSINGNGTLGFATGSTFGTVLQDAYNNGARVHSNSWGYNTDGSYNDVSAVVDTFIAQHPDMVICFSAGNSGVDTNADGLVDAGSMRAPGTAKNCITVGASENDRPTIGSIYGTSYGNPIAGDLVANNPSGLAAFSSRGPCQDPAGPNGELRIKPDVCAPGTYIASARTSYTAVGPEGFETAANGSVPPSWARSSATWAVTSDDAFSGSKCIGYGSINSGYPALAGNQRVSLPGADLRTAGSYWLLYRTRYNLRPGDQAIPTTAGSGFSSSAFTGSSGGWVYRADRIPNSIANPTTVDLYLVPGSSTAGGNFFWEIDDVRVVPALTDTLGRNGTESPGSARDLAYHYSNGTSMACPQVAGLAALARQYYQEVRNHFTPSAALVKATLLTSAFHMAPGQYASPQEVPSARPNGAEGWGRVDLQKALAPQTTTAAGTRLLYADVKGGLNVNESDSYQLSVATGTPLNIGLVYTDPPAANAASVALVNNLDLSVTGPGGTFRGNGVPGDTRNNVETIDLGAGLPGGTYTVTVSAANVPQGPQPYALVIYGDASYVNRLQVSPGAARCPLGQVYPFTALFDGRPTSGVTWSVVSGGGTISSSGLYTAPVTGSTATIRATQGSVTRDAVITLIPAAPIIAHVEIQHTFPSDLTTICVGAGNTASPTFLTTSQPGSNTTDGTGTTGYIRRDFNISAGAASLPPSAASPWFLQVTDNATGDTGQIRVFYITYNGVRYTARDLPAPVADFATSFAFIDPPPFTVSLTAPTAGSTLSGSTTFTATATATATRVEFYVDDRLLGTDTSAPYSMPWNTSVETNGPHRLSVRAADGLGNTADQAVVVSTSNSGSRPNAVLSVGNWNFDSVTRVLTCTATFTNSGSAKAWRVTLQRLTLWGTGSTFTGERPIYLQPAAGVPLPRSLGSLEVAPAAGSSVTLDLKVTVPPEMEHLPRWTGTGYYYNAQTGGLQYYL